MHDTTHDRCLHVAPAYGLDGHTRPFCSLASGHTGEHDTGPRFDLGIHCTWDGDHNWHVRRLEARGADVHASNLLDALERLIAGNARITDVSRDAHGVVSVTHATRGTFRGGTLRESLALLLVACGVDVP